MAKKKGKKHDPNPTRDPDVQRGIDKYNKERKEKDIKDHYEVHKTGGAVKGPEKDHN